MMTSWRRWRRRRRQQQQTFRNETVPNSGTPILPEWSMWQHEHSIPSGNPWQPHWEPCPWQGLPSASWTSADPSLPDDSQLQLKLGWRISSSSFLSCTGRPQRPRKAPARVARLKYEEMRCRCTEERLQEYFVAMAIGFQQSALETARRSRIRVWRFGAEAM